VYEFIPGIHSKGFGWEYITINSLGFRSPELDPQKPVIAVVGDSYAFGYGVDDDETNPAQLQKAFPDYNVVNAGVNGYNIEQEAIQYKAKIQKLNPALTIVEFVFNDMDPKGHIDSDGIMRVGIQTQEEEQKAIAANVTKPGLINFPGKAFLQNKSAIFNFIERTTKWLPFRKKVDTTVETLTDDQLAFYETWFTTLNESITGDKKLFVIWPENHWHEKSRAFLKTLAKKKGFVVLDLYDVFGNGYKPLLWDFHPNAASQKKAAEAIYRTINEEHLLPEM
jgi:lysophospholipase L1-like esterase